MKKKSIVISLVLIAVVAVILNFKGSRGLNCDDFVEKVNESSTSEKNKIKTIEDGILDGGCNVVLHTSVDFNVVNVSQDKNYRSHEYAEILKMLISANKSFDAKISGIIQGINKDKVEGLKVSKTFIVDFIDFPKEDVDLVFNQYVIESIYDSEKKVFISGGIKGFNGIHAASTELTRGMPEKKVKITEEKIQKALKLNEERTKIKNEDIKEYERALKENKYKNEDGFNTEFNRDTDKIGFE